jgi:type IV pilus assembly protein PilF
LLWVSHSAGCVPSGDFNPMKTSRAAMARVAYVQLGLGTCNGMTERAKAR